MPLRRHAVLPLLLLTVSSACCSRASAETKQLPTVQMQIGSKTFTLEVAIQDEDMEHGLMERTSMPADHGMIFVFPNEAVRTFWMKNTLIPLDIIFLDADFRIVSIKQMKPMDESITSSDDPAKFAIELNKDIVATTGVKVGDSLPRPGSVRPTTQASTRATTQP